MVDDERARAELRAVTDEHRHRLAAAAERARSALERADRPAVGARRPADPVDDEDYSTRTWLR